MSPEIREEIDRLKEQLHPSRKIASRKEKLDDRLVKQPFVKSYLDK